MRVVIKHPEKGYRSARQYWRRNQYSPDIDKAVVYKSRHGAVSLNEGDCWVEVTITEAQPSLT